MLEPAIRDLAAMGTNFGTLAVPLPNGQTLSHVMWVDATDEQILINTEVHRAKYRAIQQHPEVTVTIWDAQNPYRYAEVRGRVIGEVRGDEARRLSVQQDSAIAGRRPNSGGATTVEKSRELARGSKALGGMTWFVFADLLYPP